MLNIQKKKKKLSSKNKKPFSSKTSKTKNINATKVRKTFINFGFSGRYTILQIRIP